jgi:hypothetical protein
LGTDISDRVLWTIAVTSLVGAVTIGLAGIGRVGLGSVVFIAVGPLLVLGYNLELFGGRFHNDLAFAVTWGAFPVVTAYFAEAERLDATAVAGAVAAFAFSYAQRGLSTPARMLRRRVDHVEGALHMADGSVRVLDRTLLLDPLEQALRTLSWAMVVLAVALLLARAV